MENEGIYWDILPQRRLDRKTYKGKGRPKNSDYYIVSPEQIKKEFMIADDYMSTQFLIHGATPKYIVCSVGESSNSKQDGK